MINQDVHKSRTNQLKNNTKQLFDYLIKLVEYF